MTKPGRKEPGFFFSQGGEVSPQKGGGLHTPMQAACFLLLYLTYPIVP